MSATHRRHRQTPPTRLLFADQRVLGLTLAVRAKAFVVLAVLLPVLILASLVTFEAQVSDNHTKSQRQLKALACLLVSFTPPGNTLGDEIRAQYHCPPYRPPPASKPRPTPTATMTVTHTVPAPTSPTAGAVGPIPAPTPSRAATSTTAPAPRPVASPHKKPRQRRTPVPPVPPVPPAPPVLGLPVPPQLGDAVETLCHVLPLVCGQLDTAAHTV